MDAPEKGKDELSSWEKARPKFQKKSASEFFDPCQDYADRSLRCMRRNNQDRTMCSDYFQAYRDCKKEWILQMKQIRQS